MDAAATLLHGARMRSRAFSISLAVLLTALPLSGCLTLAAVHQLHEQREFERRNAFDARAHDWALASGATVIGRLAVTTNYQRRNGVIENIPTQTLHCANLLVRLIPDTTHMRDLMAREYSLLIKTQGDYHDNYIDTATRWSWPEPESANYIRETTCGPEGEFTFPATPSGHYLLFAQVHPTADRAAEVSFDTVLKPVFIESGHPLDVRILTGVWRDGIIQPQ
ncbi:hypothetical protein [Brevundimonas diminuta]|uniref:hypothetical protein n=1 Tax=Brevundimonas diminuta TaxID=293 RepID=UPI003D0663CC